MVFIQGILPGHKRAEGGLGRGFITKGPYDTAGNFTFIPLAKGSQRLSF